MRLNLMAALGLLIPLAVNAADAGLQAALQRGRDSVQVCRPQMHEDADEYLDCLRLRVKPQKTKGRMVEAERLGAAWFGWAFADLSAANSLPGADAAAQELLLDSVALQKRLKVKDAQLCTLLEDDCQRVLNRRKERLAMRR